MNWKYKALAQRALSTVPYGVHVNSLLSRHVTKTMPRSDAEFIEIVARAKDYSDAFRKYSERNIADAVCLEIGAGQDFAIPLAMYAFGVNHHILLDIQRLVSWKLVNDTIEKIQRLGAQLGMTRIPDRHANGRRDLLSILKDSYGMDYRAPCHARSTGLDSESVDLITSTAVLQHVPLEEIRAMMGECRRLLRRGGLVCHLIGYHDHYADFDRKISVYNFLQYSDKAWRLYSPALQYQNRLRHRDYVELAQAAGFEVVAERREDGSSSDLDTLRRLPLNERFRGYIPEELAVRSGLIVLRKSGASKEDQ